MHDNNNGTISAIDVSYDGNYVITVGKRISLFLVWNFLDN